MTHDQQSESSLEGVNQLCERWPEMTREEFHALLTPDQACEFLHSFIGKWTAVDLSLRLIRSDSAGRARRTVPQGPAKVTKSCCPRWRL
jgi:hypothetical protein